MGISLEGRPAGEHSEPCGLKISPITLGKCRRDRLRDSGTPLPRREIPPAATSLSAPARSQAPAAKAFSLRSRRMPDAAPTSTAESLYAPHGRPGRFYNPWRRFPIGRLDLLRWKLARN